METRAQSAMEYLMTYGWAILIIAVVLAALYQLGVFGNTNTLGTVCQAEPGFECTGPALNASGYLGVTLGQVGGNTTITGVACTNGTNVPTTNQIISEGSSPIKLFPDTSYDVVFKCPIVSGQTFTGSLWLQYDAASQTGLLLKFAQITAQASTTGPVGQLAPPYTSEVTTSTFANTVTVTMDSGYNYYFCGAGYQDGETSISWTQDEASYDVGYPVEDIGHQSSNICTTTQNPGCGTCNFFALVGVGVKGSAYSVLTNGGQTGGSQSFSFSYTASSSQHSYIIITALAGITSYSLPSGCTVLQRQNVTGYGYPGVLAVACSGQSGLQSVSGDTSTSYQGYVAWAVYGVSP